ncbi:MULTISPECIES: nuclear transport factor 2 family protein [Actinomadura]|uniref:Predicted SnoaL-like aldol condensation-catalyzing enzyme n=1 Tax=Actinomadura madurae TaxID=1993 RepID=A0A1I5BVB9_9ACTN|nr:nuclear transport factor 2 family protein [Actinomadura madurae]SFN78749.1 Predicted SnoaL-like aldol condensation-catalyzing enzyme [Actinomadura madurae]
MSAEIKNFVQRALAELIQTGDVDAFGKYLSDDFVHRRPDSTRNRVEWLAALRYALGPLAGMRVEILHVLADGDRVVMHSRRGLPGGPEIVVVDVLRVQDGLVAEVWEIIEPVAQAAAHLEWWETAGR